MIDINRSWHSCVCCFTLLQFSAWVVGARGALVIVWLGSTVFLFTLTLNIALFFICLLFLFFSIWYLVILLLYILTHMPGFYLCLFILAGCFILGIPCTGSHMPRMLEPLLVLPLPMCLTAMHIPSAHAQDALPQPCHAYDLCSCQTASSCPGRGSYAPCHLHLLFQVF